MLTLAMKHRLPVLGIFAIGACIAVAFAVSPLVAVLIVLSIFVAIVIAWALSRPRARRGFVTGVRAAVCDVAFTYRMGAGFAGDVNRLHPAAIEAALMDEDDPVEAYGRVGIPDAANNTIRGIVAADQSDNVDLVAWGALVRPYPTQQQTGGMTSDFGGGTPPTSGAVDFLRNGLIMAQLNDGVTEPVKGGRVYVWAAATAGDHLQGGYETEISAGNTVRLDARYTYNGPPDANGVVEISFNV